ncbi:hypothetical protein MRX96_019478 [Rhipicephalus microplus]
MADMTQRACTESHKSNDPQIYGKSQRYHHPVGAVTSFARWGSARLLDAKVVPVTMWSSAGDMLGTCAWGMVV